MTTSALPEDPYHALGVAKDATAAAIKTAYRKLVLKHHPDKIQDEAQKRAATDLFHKVQTAWETIGDEEKRKGYDAQCRLASLRKEANDRQAPFRSDARPQYRDRRPSYPPPPPTSTRDDRTSYRTEEVRPTETAYFDKPRSAESRDYDLPYDRPRRTAAREDRHRRPISRQDSKESERAQRQQKVRQHTRATAKDRDYKYAYVQVESDSDSDHYVERRRSPREESFTRERRKSPREDDGVRERRRSPREDDFARERRRSPREDNLAREKLFEQARKQQEEMTRYDTRPSDKFSEAKDYIERSSGRRQAEVPRRPSPRREETSYFRGLDGRPVAVRRGSGRPRTTTTTTRDDVDVSRRSRRETERSSDEYDESPRRMPGMPTAKSAPQEIHMPFLNKQRANSAQLSREQMTDFLPSPIKRADTMPVQPSRREEIRSKPVRQSTLRQTQINEDYDSRSKPSGRPSKEYADDYEKATPEGYVIEPRQPERRNRSPEPIREKPRAASTRYATHGSPVLPPLNTRSTSYVMSPAGGVEPVSARPKLSRGDSSRKGSLFGEIPSVSPRDREQYTVPPPSSIKTREIRPDYNSYSRRASDARSPSYYRNVPPLSG